MPKFLDDIKFIDSQGHEHNVSEYNNQIRTQGYYYTGDSEFERFSGVMPDTNIPEGEISKQGRYFTGLSAGYESAIDQETGRWNLDNVEAQNGEIYKQGSYWVAQVEEAAETEEIWGAIEELQQFDVNHSNLKNGEGPGSLQQVTFGDDAKNPKAIGFGAVALGGFRGDKPDSTPTPIPTDDATVNNMTSDDYNDTTSKVTGVQSVVFGAGNRAYGDWNFIMGKDSKTVSTGSFIFGGKCYVGDPSRPHDYFYSMAIGSANSVMTPYSLASGYNNSISIHGDASAVIGVDNTLQASYSLLVGKGNSVTNDGNDAFSSAAIGEGNILSTSYGYALGKNNKIKNLCSTAIGIGNVILSSFSTTIGRELITREVGQIVLGKFNEDKISKCVLVLGNGKDGNHRSNAFEVLEDGVARAYGTPAGNNDLVNLRFMIDHIYWVGIIIETYTDVNPSNFLLGTTWESFGQGRVTVGYNGDDSDFNEAGKTGGEKTHELSEDEMPFHSHIERVPAADDVMGATHIAQMGTGSFGSEYGANCDSLGLTVKNNCGYYVDTEGAGSGLAHNNLQPYVVVYRWRRTA